MTFTVPYTPAPAFVRSSSRAWEGYFDSASEDTSNIHALQAPAPCYSEMQFEKKQEDMFDFIEEDAIPYSDEYSNRDFYENFESPDSDFAYTSDQTSERSQSLKKEEESEHSSMSTENGYSFNDMQTYRNSFVDANSNLEEELTNKARLLLQNKSEEEKAYIDKVWPMLLSSLKEAYTTSNLPLTNEIVRVLLEQLLYGKQVMIGAEKLVLDNIANEEMEEVSYSRPDERVTMEELNMNNRKEKKAVKGNRNSSSLNHLNENYVSNIFQFAKRNYPEDRDVQKIGNERNISALNFKRMTQPKINDDIMVRRARARINASGKELVGNIEYWMKDGYFDQCADRQKYLVHKEKALRDLALSGKN